MKSNLKSIIRDINELRERMKEFISSLPEANTGVKILQNNPRCGVVNFSTIGKNHGILSATYYLNATVKEVLLKRIETTATERLESVIDKIINEGRIKMYGRTENLNPDFIKALKGIWKS